LIPKTCSDTTAAIPLQNPMHQIFLSYASADRERAKQLAEAMQRHGYRIWWDRHIAPGQVFDEVIERALNDSACVIVLWSHTSVNSQWVKTEASEAASRGILVPARLDDVKIPLEFRRMQAGDLTRWNGDSRQPEFLQFLRAVDREIEEFGERVAEAPTLAATPSSAAVGPGASRAPAAAAADRMTPSPPAETASHAAAVAAPKRLWGRWVAAVAALALVAGVAAWFYRGSSPLAPDVVGMPYERAVAALAARGLTAERREQASNGAPGMILAQAPPAGTDVPEDGQVVLTVAVAAAPVDRTPAVANTANAAAAEAPPVEPLATIPDLRGHTTVDASALLGAADLTLGGTTEIAANDVALGTIVDQMPAAAQTLPKGSPVQITVAARRSVPDLVGLDVQEAQQALTRLGLEPRVERVRARRGDRDDRVIAQVPAVGSDITAAGVVTVTVSTVVPKKVGGGENLFRTDGRPCVQACQEIGLQWTKEWSGRPANTCTCDFP
jgi:beta-lactam-binding protein with PASTA domain